jgi:drug/metabolite transporter (DMT)-like permease
MSRFRPLMYAAMAGLLVSGVYQIARRPGHTRLYDSLLGLKLLLAAHVFAAALLIVHRAAEKTGAPKIVRRMTGIVISGFTIVLIAAFLRRIF